MNYIRQDHPRSESLRIRKKLAEGFKKGLVTPEGLSAHGRGEAFDYILGEKTTKQAKKAIKAGVAEILLADKPVFSVNGNVAALVPEEIAKINKEMDVQVEVNLFHKSKDRKRKIEKYLKKKGVEEVLGTEIKYHSEIPEIRSQRRKVDERGIKSADTVIIPLEDGDRTEALKKLGKKTVTIDLNPLSRTANAADITIVDNIVRALPLLIEETSELSQATSKKLEKISTDFHNKQNLHLTVRNMLDRLKKLSKN
ncbi:hypothetical protein AKJ57_04250 [candidate division MSBL1 archaeon SCGC-AAA259A05]|uniref:4-phosphopantoate--beta-alanine ligase n=1 Tax=candidate division MSBL1 archaeon SCGC-AAA259A05 TaxID=1698259 RepID=A0A133U822_9EURY|nr:hypothetical protein AKJ57_04250 [candidate division MSBL1 archaeon SCGC-AAA259A05]